MGLFSLQNTSHIKGSVSNLRSVLSSTGKKKKSQNKNKNQKEGIGFCRKGQLNLWKKELKL